MIITNHMTAFGFYLAKQAAKKIKADEALCFGWIDGQMKSIDDKTYKKYFSLHRANSKWSDKNKALFKRLEEQEIMTDCGR